MKANCLHIQRGHETAEHRAMKGEMLQALGRAAFSIALCEHRCCDVVAIKKIGAASCVVAVEIERSVRNAVRNIERNFSDGCDFTLVVCPDARVLGEVTRKLSRKLPRELLDRIGLMNLRALRLIHPNGVSETHGHQPGSTP